MRIKDCLRDHGIKECEYIESCSSMNAGIYTIKQKGEPDKILKIYHDNDVTRYNRECTFLSHMRRINCQKTCKLISKGKTRTSILMNKVKGEKPSSINNNIIIQTANFIGEINKRGTKNHYKYIWSAKDCLKEGNSLEKDIRNRIKKCIDTLSIIENKMESQNNSYAKNMVRELKVFLVNEKIDFSSIKHNEQDQIISPSDIGIHNMLKNHEEKILFLDFEYSGWDDIAKLTCDMILQPNSILSRKQTELWVDSISNSGLISSGDWIKNVKELLPILRVKWTTIMLNKLNDTEKLVQIEKVKKYINLTSYAVKYLE